MDLNKFYIGSKSNNVSASFSPFGNDRLVSISGQTQTAYYSLPRLVSVSYVFEFAASLDGVVNVWVGE
jgi:hypothetical protein